MAKKKVILRTHKGIARTAEGEELHYEGRQPNVRAMRGLLSARDMEQAEEGEQLTDEQQARNAQRTIGLMDAYLATIHTINGTPAEEFTMEDLAFCVADLMDFFNAAASSEKPPPQRARRSGTTG